MRSHSGAIDDPRDVVNLQHQQPTVDTPRTLFSAALVVIAIVLSCMASRAVYFALLHPPSDRSPTPLRGEGSILPAEPRLEGIERMSAGDAVNPAANDEQLQKYGWTNRKTKTVHIPIQQAMDLGIERGWLRSAAHPQQEVPKDIDTPKPSAANSSAK
jgi:hypothetical protein